VRSLLPLAPPPKVELGGGAPAAAVDVAMVVEAACY
jgi:hypothetical protein